MKHPLFQNSFRKLPRLLSAFSLSMAMALLSVNSTKAAVLIWTNGGGDSTWSTTSSAADWSTGVAPKSTDTVNFATQGSTTITIGSGSSAPSTTLIQFGDTTASGTDSNALSYTLGTAPNAGTINVTARGSGNIGFLTYYGTGNTATQTVNANLVLGNASDSNGWIIANNSAGELDITGNITRQATETTTFGALIVQGTNDVTITGAITGFRSVSDYLAAGATMIIAGTNGTTGGFNIGNMWNGSYGNLLIKTSALSGPTNPITIYAGGTGAGTLQLEGDIDLSKHGVTIADGRTSVAGGGGSAHIENISGNNSIGTITLGNPNAANSGDYDSVKLDAGTLTIAAIGTNITNVGTTDTQNIYFYGGGNATVTGTIDDTGNTPIAIEENNDGGILTLKGAGTYAGGTTLDAGTLVAANASALGVAGSAVTINGGTLDLATDTSVNAYNTVVTASATILSDQATAGSTGITQTLGTLAIGADTLNVQAGSNVTGSSAGVAFGDVTLTENGTTILNPTTASLSVNNVTGSTGSGTSTLDLDGTSSGNAVTGAITDFSGGKVAVSKTNTSTWTLSGTNTYTGDTTVTGGTLNVTGSLSAASAVNVTNARLEGTGSVGAVSVGAGGVLAPGSTTTPGSLGTLTAGSVNFLSTATLSFALNSDNASADLLFVNGTLTLNNASLQVIDVGSSILTGATVFELASYGSLSGTFAGLADGSEITIGGNIYEINYGSLVSNEITLKDISAVPEPAIWQLMLPAIALFGLMRYRKSLTGVQS